MDRNDLISREALIKWIDDSVSQYGNQYSTDMLNMWGLFKDYLINNAPTVDITEEQAIDKLHETGWLPMHDKIMTKSPKDEWYITPDRQITIEEYMQKMKGENQ